MSSDGVVYPTRVAGTTVAHLAHVELRASGVGYRAICRGPDDAPLLLEPVPEGAPISWCGACASWAAAAGVELPAGGARRPDPWAG